MTNIMTKKQFGINKISVLLMYISAYAFAAYLLVIIDNTSDLSHNISDFLEVMLYMPLGVSMFWQIKGTYANLSFTYII